MGLRGGRHVDKTISQYLSLDEARNTFQHTRDPATTGESRRQIDQSPPPSNSSSFSSLPTLSSYSPLDLDPQCPPAHRKVSSRGDCVSGSRGSFGDGDGRSRREGSLERGGEGEGVVGGARGDLWRSVIGRVVLCIVQFRVVSLAAANCFELIH